jgi:hypothetical protein
MHPHGEDPLLRSLSIRVASLATPTVVAACGETDRAPSLILLRCSRAR